MEIIDCDEFITCRVCGKKSTRIYGAHLKSHNMTSEIYKKTYPDAPLMTKGDLEIIKKNSGLHMKDEKYKKMFSEMFSGEKNPNHKNNTTEEERKSRSPFSKNFIKYKDDENMDLKIKEFTKKALKNRLTTTQLDYWLSKGYSKEESVRILSDRQRTFSLEKCIEKYGEDKGYKRWINRQEKWLNNYKESNYSKISQECFISIFNKLKEYGFNHDVYFASLDENKKIHDSNRNFEYRLKLNKSYILPDFFIPELKLIIEFDGTYYHRLNSENKKREENRDKNIIESGYNVIHIKELDYINNKELLVYQIVDDILKRSNK